MRLGTNHDAPTSEIIPKFGPKTNLNFADSAATTISPVSARPTPPPAAIPFIALTTGFVDCVIALTRGLKAFSILTEPASPGVKPLVLGHPPSTRSAPEQKPLPLPVIIIDRTFLSALASLRPSKSPIIKSAFIAFRVSGLFKLNFKTPLSFKFFSIVLFISFPK